MEIKHNVVGWFEIPVENMDRAITFYETVLGLKLQRQQLGPLEMAWFPWVENSIGSPGGLVFSPGNYKPSTDGILIYLTAFSGDCAIEAARAEAAGGKVLVPRRIISEEIGFMAVILDSEGNRIALHSHK
jgi:uncharacterized protein